MSNLRDSSKLIEDALDVISHGLAKPIHEDADMDYHSESVEILKRLRDRLQKL